jgi:hypothetical protein
MAVSVWLMMLKTVVSPLKRVSKDVKRDEGSMTFI